jgi:hypothetical protein
MKKFLIWMVIILLLLSGPFVYWKYYFTYSEGNRAGLLQKFSYRGNIFKTYEGELVLSSVESNKNLAAKLSNLESHIVVVHYRQKNGILPWRGETDYIVDSVRESR